MIRPTEQTVIQTFNPEDGDKTVTMLTLDGVTLAIDSQMPLTIDGKKWAGRATA